MRKNTHTAVNEKKKIEKRFCFITGCFIKPFKIIINLFFLISQGHSQRSFCFLISGIPKGENGNGKLNIYFKNNFSLLVMNVTQLNFLN